MSRSLADIWFDPFREKDVAKLEAALADDFTHTSPFGAIDGKAAYVDLVRRNEKMFFANPIEVVDVIDLGDRCAVRYVVGAMAACDCIYGADGKVSRVFSYYHVGEPPVM
jgi:hypothetical protein